MEREQPDRDSDWKLKNILESERGRQCAGGLCCVWRKNKDGVGAKGLAEELGAEEMLSCNQHPWQVSLTRQLGTPSGQKG